MYKNICQYAFILLLAALFALAGCTMQEEDPQNSFAALINSRADEGNASRADPGYTQYIEKQSLQAAAAKMAQMVSGSNYLWRRPAAKPQPEALNARGSVWLHLNPQTLQTPSRASLLAHLSSPALWAALNKNAITGLYLAPTGGSGSIWDENARRSLGNNDDVIQYSFAKTVGNEQEYAKIIELAKAQRVLLGGDLLPTAGGIGPDFMLATRNLRDYPGLFCLIEVPRQMWANLPPVRPQGGDLQLSPLTPKQQQKLTEGGLFPKALQQDALAQYINTGWAATGEIRGMDGNLRRWVYRYAYNHKRPILNFSDPSKVAHKVMSASVIFQSGVLGNMLLAHEISPLLGLEPENTPDKNITASSSYSLALEVSNSLSRQSRAYGSYALLKDELPLPLLYEAMQKGPDLVLDSLLSPAAEHALLTGDAALLNFMADEALNFNIDWRRLVHASTGYAGVSYKLPHLKYLADLPASAKIQGKRIKLAKALLQITLEQVEELASRSAYDNTHGEQRLYTTPVGIAAIAQGVYSSSGVNPSRVANIRRGHMLLQFFKAMQPGVFMTTGQDLTGVMPIDLNAENAGQEPYWRKPNKQEAVRQELNGQNTKGQDSDGLKPDEQDPVGQNSGEQDPAGQSSNNLEAVGRNSTTLNQNKKLALLGSYPLLSSAENTTASSLGLPRARTLYGSIDAQSYHANSFVSELGNLLKLREKLGIAAGTVIWRFQPSGSGIFALAMRLPDSNKANSDKALPAYAIAICNFSQAGTNESFDLGLVPELKKMLNSEATHDAEIRFLEGNIEALRKSDESLSFYAPSWSWGLILINASSDAVMQKLGQLVPNASDTEENIEGEAVQELKPLMPNASDAEENIEGAGANNVEVSGSPNL